MYLNWNEQTLYWQKDYFPFPSYLLHKSLCKIIFSSLDENVTRDQSLSLPISRLTRKVQNAFTLDLTLENLFYLFDSDFRSDSDFDPWWSDRLVCTDWIAWVGCCCLQILIVQCIALIPDTELFILISVPHSLNYRIKN